jgi:hypothetical protein
VFINNHPRASFFGLLLLLGIYGKSYGLGNSVNPAERLEREEKRRVIQQELRRQPEQVRLPEDSGALRFESFPGTIKVNKIELLGTSC